MSQVSVGGSGIRIGIVVKAMFLQKVGVVMLKINVLMLVMLFCFKDTVYILKGCLSHGGAAMVVTLLHRLMLVDPSLVVVLTAMFLWGGPENSILRILILLIIIPCHTMQVKGPKVRTQPHLVEIVRVLPGC